MKKYFKIIVVTIISMLTAWALLALVKRPLFTVDLFDKDIINFYAVYQPSALLLSLSFLAVLYVLADRTRLRLLNFRRIDGPVRPAPWAGIRPKPNEGWKSIGLSIGFVITAVTAAVVYAQVAGGRGLTFRLFPDIPLILLFAAANAFTEEVIFRLSFATVAENDGLDARISEGLSAAVFGGLHYFGIAPSGIPGVLMAAFIGWFLSKSIHETKGFFWAWGIHFAQDVAIMFFLFMKN